MGQDIEVRTRFVVDDRVLSDLHARAFGRPSPVQPWAARLHRHSLTWVGAFDAEALVGFAHAVWDGGPHAFLLDTVVDPARQRRGIGRRLVRLVVEEATAAGCDWLHVDYEPHLRTFYRDSCGFRPTRAGLLSLAR